MSERVTFVLWLYASGHTPSAWQLELARKLDEAGPGGVVQIVGGSRYGKTWLLDRWAEYHAAVRRVGS